MLRTDPAFPSSYPEDAHAKIIPDIDTLKSLLKARRVDISRWGQGNAKTVESLYAELTSGETELRDNPFCRVLTGVVQLIIHHADGRILLEGEQVFHDGRRRQRNLPPSEKMLLGETYLETARRCLAEELQLSPESYHITQSSHEHREVMRSSFSYPGLLSKYTIHKLDVVVDGLPEDEFWTQESSVSSDDTVVQHRWIWSHNNCSVF